jgi:hypothetical protein
MLFLVFLFLLNLFFNQHSIREEEQVDKRFLLSKYWTFSILVYSLFYIVEKELTHLYDYLTYFYYSIYVGRLKLKVMMKRFIKVNVLHKSNVINIHHYLIYRKHLLIVIILIIPVNILMTLYLHQPRHLYLQLH